MEYKEKSGRKNGLLLHLMVIIKINRRLNLKSQMIKKKNHGELISFTKRKGILVRIKFHYI